jgi:hypothetical protein
VTLPGARALVDITLTFIHSCKSFLNAKTAAFFELCLNYVAVNPVGSFLYKMHARHTRESKFKYPAKYFLKSCAVILKTAFVYFL